MAYGEGKRRKCGECGHPLGGDSDNISHRELRGPRGITASNVAKLQREYIEAVDTLGKIAGRMDTLNVRAVEG